VAAKILEPGLDHAAYSLKPVLKRFLAVEISKDLQVSDWLAPHLSDEQLMYAANDVMHLVDLCQTLRGACEVAGLGQVLTESWRYLPVRVALDMRGSGDVFSY
jgi:ribonuclease D